ncbi:MAG TPA: thioredoxin [Firmicutes bacterium]|nr:thioredoxin [Bacillota bacterium]
MAINETNSPGFKNDVLEASNKQPVVVDFWAPWCGPCRMISPIIAELDNEYQGEILFYKLNIDDNPDIASQFNVMSIPTLILFRNGKIADTVVGVTSKAALKKKFDDHLLD